MQPCHHDFWCKVFGDRNFSSSDSWPSFFHPAPWGPARVFRYPDTLTSPPKWRHNLKRRYFASQKNMNSGYLFQISGGQYDLQYQKGAVVRETTIFGRMSLTWPPKRGYKKTTFHMASFHMSTSSMQNFETNNSSKFNSSPLKIYHTKRKGSSSSPTIFQG